MCGGLLVNRGALTDTFSGPKNMPTFSTFLSGRGLGVLDLLQDRPGGLGGVVGAGDGAADDEHGGSVGDGPGWGGDALLIFNGAACGTDSGDDEECVGGGFFAEDGDLFGGADHAVDA
jgi:hypothetical protein